MNLIEKVLEAMQTDDEDLSEQSQSLENIYITANKQEKKVIDDCFIALCGWSLSYLINNR